MRPIDQPLKTLRLMPSQPRMQRLPRHPDLRGHLEIDNPSLITANTA